MEFKIKSVLANGIACVEAYNLVGTNFDQKALDKDSEIKKLNNAFKAAINDLDEMERNNPSQKDYIDVQRLMLTDEYLYDNIIKKIKMGHSAYKGIDEVINNYIESLNTSVSSYLNERVNDFNDIKHRLVYILGDVQKISLNKNSIIITNEIYPSFFIKNQSYISGIIVKKGGFTSHVAIMCRSLDIPFVIYEDDLDVETGKIVLIDTLRGVIKTHMNSSELLKINNDINQIKNENDVAIKHDGYLFLANISSNEEIDKINNHNFDGVGLYRTEMIFMMSNRPYTLEEQKEIYLDAVRKLKDKYIVFRTFDIGDDKNLTYLKTYSKGIDNYINNKEIFETQIKAMLEANVYGNIRIMFPMIFTNYEFNFLRNWVLRINNEINGKKVSIGMMLETKNAINNIDTFENLDFISVGTNDLTTELYHINRLDGLDKVNSYLDDLLLKLKNVVELCNKKNICFSICGELAGNIESALAFYKIGVRNLSVNPGAMKTLNLVYSKYKGIK